MSIPRRTFLKGGLAAGAVLAGPAVVPAVAAPSVSALRPMAFRRLPPGAVTPRGWLSTQLDRQLNGLAGRYQEASHFLRFDGTGWVRPELDGWEEVPYWLRGYGDLGYVTGSRTVLTETERWIEAVIATQADDGYFGPTALRTVLNGHADLWPHMPMLHALRSWAEYHDDARIDDLLSRYFAFMAGQPDAVFADGWGATRWADTIDVVYWLHERTGDASLLELTHRIHQHSANWVNTVASPHNVNFAQGFREPALYWLLSGDDGHRSSVYHTYEQVMSAYGQFPGGGFAGDENIRVGYGDPRQGFETCGIVEFMASHELLTRITGDPLWADRTEDLAFNMLPASLDPQGKSVHYVTSANSIQLDDVAKRRRQFQNGFAMQAYLPGVDNYRCCPHNYGQGWPYYVEEMWLATPDGGVAAALYGPCSVTVPVAGTTVTITEDTAYPFGDTITFTFSLPTPTAFPFTVRVPGWCASPKLAVNGTSVDVGPGFTPVQRTWQDGDTAVLTLPMTPTTRTWAGNHDAMSVDYGALTFSLRIDEQWHQFGGSADFPEYEVKPGSAWNVGLVPDTPLAVTTGGDVADPFTLAGAPIRITAQAKEIPDWAADGEQVVGTLQGGPVATTGQAKEVELVPMGAARLRITTFPRIGGTTPWGTLGMPCRIQNLNSAKVLSVDGSSTEDSANVVQFGDDGRVDQRWRIVDLGNGTVKIRNENSGKVLGVQMSTEDSAQVVQFTADGTADHRWAWLDNGDGWFRLRNTHSGKVLGVDQMSGQDAAKVVQFADTGTADHLWRVVPDGVVRIQNLNSAKVLGVENGSTANSARIVQFADNGQADHDWEFLPDANGYFRIRNTNSGKVLGVDQMSTEDSAQVVQFDDTGTADHLWRLRADSDNLWRVQNASSGKVLAVTDMSLDDTALVVQFADNGTADHLWRLLG